MIALEYTGRTRLEEVRYRSCDRCGINMKLESWSLRRQCDDCIDFDIFEWGQFDWLFRRLEGKHLAISQEADDD